MGPEDRSARRGVAMSWAIYARLSRDDDNGSSAVESCAVQEANARRFIAARNGGEPRAFTDDGISGATLDDRAGLQAALASARDRRFTRLVVRDLDRLARGQIWQWWVLGELSRAGVEVWCYSDGKRIETSGVEGMMTALRGFAAEQERSKCVERTREGIRRRAELGRACHAAPIGYRIVRLPDGSADYEIVPAKAGVIVDLAARYVCHEGNQSAVVRELNEAGVRTPRGGHWEVEAIRRTLENPLYRGLIVHGKRGLVVEGGRKRWVNYPPETWVRVERPELRILTPDLAASVDRLLATPRPRAWAGAAAPRWLSSRFVACSLCGGSVCATAGRYRCQARHQKGRHACEGVGSRPFAEVDQAVLAAVARLLTGDLAEKALADLQRRLEAEVRGEAREAERARLRKDRADRERRVANLTDAIASGSPPAALVARLRDEERAQVDARARLAELDRMAPAHLDVRRAMVAARKRLADLAQVAEHGGIEARPAVAAVLQGARFRAVPISVRGQRRWQLTAEIGAGYLTPNDGAQGRGFRATAPGFDGGISTSRTIRCTR